jgi:uncharacterized coiled-coil protein SlyX
MEKDSVKKVLYNEVSLVFAIGAFILGAYIYVTKPGAQNDVAIQLQEQRITAQRTTIDELTKTQQNEVKEVKNEIAGLRTEMQALTNSVVKLQTIIEERIPPKK